MRNLAFTIFALLSLSFFACEEQLQDVRPEDAPPVDTLEVVMNDSVWREDSIEISNLWRLYWQSDEIKPDSAIYYCREIIRMAEPALSHRYDSNLYICYAKGYGGIGHNLMKKGHLDEALKYTLKSYELVKCKFGENHIRNTELFVGVSENYAKRGDYEQAIIWQKKGLVVMKAIFPDTGHWYFGNILSNIANFYEQKGDYYKALEYYFFILDRSKEFPEEALHQPRVLRCIANCYIKTGQYHRALSYLEESEQVIEILKKTSKEWFAPSFIFRSSIINEWTKGIAHVNLGEFQLAEKYFEKVISKSGDSLPYPALCYFELGNLEKRRHNWQKSREYYNKVLFYRKDKKLRSEEGEVDAQTGIAETYLFEGKVDSCLLAYQRVLNFLSPEFSSYEINQVPNINKLTPNILLLNTVSAKGKMLLWAFQQSKQSTYLSSSFSTYSLATSLADKMRIGFKWKGSKQTLSERVLPVFNGAIITALEMYHLTGNQQYLESAFAFTERSRAYILLENLRDEDARSLAGIPNGILEKEEGINQDIAMYERFILEEEHLSEKVDFSKIYYWNAKLVELKKSQDSLLTIFERNYPDYHRLKYENLIASPTQIQDRLKPDESLIEYFLGDSTLYTFTLNKAGLNCYQQKVDSTLFETVDRLRQFAGQPSHSDQWTVDYRQFVADSRYLYQKLLEPALSGNERRSINNKQPSLIVVPDGVLNFLPFNLLLTEDPDSLTLAYYDYRNLPYLVRDFNIRYEYSATLMIESQRSKKGRFWQQLRQGQQPSYCGFAPSYGDGGVFVSRGEEDSLKLEELYPGILQRDLGSLRFNQPEVEEASLTLEGTPFLGPAATESEFKRQATQAKILHLAMHALTNDKEPLFSQLAFTKDDTDSMEDGRLHAYELYNMRLNADLAVLSACNTGAGKLQRGEGVMSLSRAFKYAGCPNVVMSLWQADDRSTQTIVTGFFKNLKTGMRKDRALCQAQREFVKTTKNQDLTHPYFWSTLMLIGDGEPLREGVSAWIILAVGIIVLMVPGWFVRQKIRIKN